MTSTATTARPSSPAAVLRRWGPWVLLVAVVVVAGVAGTQGRSHPTAAQRATAIGNRVRCPVCEGQDVNQSDTPPADAIKADIRSQVDAGRSTGEILDSIEASYGQGILERPPDTGVDLLVWLVPVLAVAAAAGGLALAFRRWRPVGRAGGDRVGPAASVADRRIVDDALAGPDAGGGPGSPGPDAGGSTGSAGAPGSEAGGER